MQIKNIAVKLNDDRTLIEIAAKHLNISVKKIANVRVLRQAIDARRRHGSEIKFIYNFEVELIGEEVKREKRRVAFVQILLLLSYATKLRSLLCWRDTELIVFVRTILVTCSLPWSR